MGQSACNAAIKPDFGSDINASPGLHTSKESPGQRRTSETPVPRRCEEAARRARSSAADLERSNDPAPSRPRRHPAASPNREQDNLLASDGGDDRDALRLRGAVAARQTVETLLIASPRARARCAVRSLAARRPAAARSVIWRRCRPASGVKIDGHHRRRVAAEQAATPRRSGAPLGCAALRCSRRRRGVSGVPRSLDVAIGRRCGAEGGHIFGSRPVARAGQPPFLQRLLRVILHMTAAVAERERFEKATTTASWSAVNVPRRGGYRSGGRSERISASTAIAGSAGRRKA